MTASAQKKTDKAPAPESTAAQEAVPSKAPALIAFHVIPVPEGKPPILTPIGAAFAHDDGEGFTLQLNLMPTTGGRIVLRTPKAKKTA